ncbi:MAG: DUF177 domain-containing protein [Chloracidobacterium sp.]|nr:DUF177 domain-containing protein [Chloracidobacterium sp.]
MIIDLDSVGKVAKAIAIAFDPAEIDLEGEDATLKGKTEFAGESQRLDGKAHIRGAIRADILLNCTRCLEPVENQVEVVFEDIFVNAIEEPNADEIEVGVDKLDESLVIDGKIDIAEVVREQLLLALPEQVFCKEDCKGLCAKCGANRNLIDCKCADNEIDPRWAALKNLN